MISQELITYIRKQTAAGVSKEVIARSLIPNGWSRQDIDQAFVSITAPPTAVSASPQVLRASSPSTGVKVFLSIAFVTASAAYAFFQYIAHPQQSPVVAAAMPTSSPMLDTSSAPATEPTQQPSGNTTTAVTPVPAPKPVGEYADGTYTGSPADAYYGTVKVQAVIQGGKLTAVNFLSYPNDRNTSRYINSQAMPQLKSEAIQAQSANVDGVSGATDTSEAFIQSLGSALAQAKN